MTKRQVTEQDFRMPEFRHAKPEDYEFREDGKLVRKDRWETGFRRIVGIVAAQGDRAEFGIKASELVQQLQTQIAQHGDQYMFGGAGDYPEAVHGVYRQDSHNNPYIPYGVFVVR